MKKNECYNELAYWDKFLAERHLSAAGFCNCGGQETLIVNASVVALDNQILSSQWLCLPNGYAVLGFLQYVYFPTVFYHVLQQSSDELKMPLVSTESFCEYIAGSGAASGAEMLVILQQLQQLWYLPEQDCLTKLQLLCTDFNATRQTGVVAQILIFEEVPQVFEYIKTQIWSEEVFYEDFGCSYSWLEKLCQSFANGSFFRYRLLHFLNERVGCLVG